jgi:hypothetical protein
MDLAMLPKHPRIGLSGSFHNFTSLMLLSFVEARGNEFIDGVTNTRANRAWWSISQIFFEIPTILGQFQRVFS